jgi:excinuclease ABC subunit B
LAHNQKHNITPRSVSRAVEESLGSRQDATDKATSLLRDARGEFDVTETIRELEQEMLNAAENLEFEKAAHLRDQVKMLKKELE